MYDWANSAFWTTVIVAVFPPFFSDYAAAGLSPAEATARFAWATTIAVTIVALLGPVLGAVADYRAVKKKLLAVFMAVGVVATLLMATIDRGEWAYAALLFVVANIGVAASLVFYDSLLPHIAAPEELDRVSTSGFALGIPRRRRAPAGEPRLDPEPGDVRPAGHRGRDQAVVCQRRGLVARSSRSR